MMSSCVLFIVFALFMNVSADCCFKYQQWSSAYVGSRIIVAGGTSYLDRTSGYLWNDGINERTAFLDNWISIAPVAGLLKMERTLVFYEQQMAYLIEYEGKIPSACTKSPLMSTFPNGCYGSSYNYTDMETISIGLQPSISGTVWTKTDDFPFFQINTTASVSNSDCSILSLFQEYSNGAKDDVYLYNIQLGAIDPDVFDIPAVCNQTQELKSDSKDISKYFVRF